MPTTIKGIEIDFERKVNMNNILEGIAMGIGIAIALFIFSYFNNRLKAVGL